MSSPRPFEPFERTTVSERVRDDIHSRIISGEIQPGSQLPAERSLADQFGVARTSVREAIQALVALGVIERRGNRSYVVEQVPGSELPAADGGKKSMRSLLEARRVLELCLFELEGRDGKVLFEDSAVGHVREERVDAAAGQQVSIGSLVW